jgi:ParB/Sulfiredoxin domain
MSKTGGESMPEKKSWRDFYKVHPAADLFPMMSKDELRKLGEDIKANGLKERVVLCPIEGSEEYAIIDGRNRLDALELMGEPILENQAARNSPGNKAQADQWGLKTKLVSHLTDSDPYDFVIFKNIRRRHLTKAEAGDLAIKAVDARRRAEEKKDLPKKGRSFSPQPGKRGGSTKDLVKQEYIEEGKRHGVAPKTMEKRIAKHRGPVLKKKSKLESASRKKPEPKPKAKSEPKLDSVQQRVVASCNCKNEFALVLQELREKKNGTKDTKSDIINWIEEKLEAFVR